MKDEEKKAAEEAAKKKEAEEASKKQPPAENDDDYELIESADPAEKVAKRVGYILRKKDTETLTRLVKNEERLNMIEAQLTSTRRELDIERVAKEYKLDDEAKALITGTTKEEINKQAKAIRGLLDKTSAADDDGDEEPNESQKDSGKNEGETERKKVPELKTGVKPKGGDPDVRSFNKDAILRRAEEAKKQLGFS